jgi:DNA polymerase-3 subunit epsilon
MALKQPGRALSSFDNDSAGVTVQPNESLLVMRARDFLAAGPATAPELISCICQQPATPGPVAEHMAMALLGSHQAFVRDGDGRWALAAAVPPPGRRADATGYEPLPGCASPGSDDRLDRLSYVVVDVETTGGRAQGDDRITEIAAVTVREGQVVDVWETLVNPQRPIPPWITRLTNISWGMVADKPCFTDICDDVLKVLQGKVFVAHNATFDWGFVTAEVSRARGLSLGGRRLCTVRLARKLLPQLPRRSLDWVAHHYGVEIGSRHRAAGDAIATAEVLQRLLGDAADRGVDTWGRLEQMLSTPSATKKRRRSSGLPRPVDHDTTA